MMGRRTTEWVLKGRGAKAGRCPGSGKPALKGLADQHYQQCRVCNRNLMMTAGGYVPTHAAAASVDSGAFMGMGSGQG